LQETEKEQFPVVTAPEVTIPQVPAVKPKVELPGMEDLAQEFPWVVQQPTELRRVPTLEEATLGVPIQIVPEIMRSLDAMRLVNELNAPTLPAEIQRDQWWIEETAPAPLETLPATPMYERDRWWLEEAPVMPAPPAAATLEELTRGVPMQIHEDIARYVEDLNLPATPMIERDRWWLEETAPATPEQSLRLNDVTLGVPSKIVGDIEASLMLMKSPQIEQLTRGVPMQIHEEIAHYVVNQ
jgi:hypothetical protein